MNNTNSAPVFLTRRQTMIMLRVSGATLDRLVVDGVIPRPLPFGNRVRWSRDVLIAHLQRRASESRVAA